MAVPFSVVSDGKDAISSARLSASSAPIVLGSRPVPDRVSLAAPLWLAGCVVVAGVPEGRNEQRSDVREAPVHARRLSTDDQDVKQESFHISPGSWIVCG